MAATFSLPCAAAVAADFKLEMPIACDVGTTCWVQQYPDHDAGPGAQDYRCGGASYDGHDGTDIRVRTTADTADVLASAAGIVKGGRNSMPDHLMKTAADEAAVANVECGNGVVIAHPGGWETQYCHMRKGSVMVKRGESVVAGQKLGEVGYSGAAAFPHIHLSVRKGGRKIDPFGGLVGEACGGAGVSLWSDKAHVVLDYKIRSVLDFGLLPEAASFESLETGAARAGTPAPEWPAIVSYVWMINLNKGDELRIILDGPNGIHAENVQTLDRNKAQYYLLSGQKRPQSGWPKGRYTAKVVLSNSGALVIEKTLEAVIE